MPERIAAQQNSVLPPLTASTMENNFRFDRVVCSTGPMLETLLFYLQTTANIIKHVSKKFFLPETTTFS